MTPEELEAFEEHYPWRGSDSPSQITDAIQTYNTRIDELEDALEKQRKESHERYMKLLGVFNTALDYCKAQVTGFAGGAWGPSQIDEEGRVWARHYKNGVEDCRILLHKPEKV